MLFKVPQIFINSWKKLSSRYSRMKKVTEEESGKRIYRKIVTLFMRNEKWQRINTNEVGLRDRIILVSVVVWGCWLNLQVFKLNKSFFSFLRKKSNIMVAWQKLLLWKGEKWHDDIEKPSCVAKHIIHPAIFRYFNCFTGIKEIVILKILRAWVSCSQTLSDIVFSCVVS